MVAGYKKLFPWFIAAAFLSFLAPTVFSAENQSDDLRPESVEQRVKAKIEGRLNVFLAPEDYRLFATAKVRNWREKVILEGETESVSSGQEKAAANAADVLPGFQQIEKKPARAKDVDRKERAKFRYRNRSEISQVLVRLLLEETLAAPVKELARETATETLALTVGDRAELEVLELALRPKTEVAETATSAWGWFTDYLDRRGGSAIDLLYLALLVLAFLSGVFALRLYFKDRKKKGADLSLPATNPSDGDQALEFCNQKLDDIIERLGQAPLASRIFLKNLAVTDKQALYAAVRSPALQEYFQKILGLGQVESTNGADRSRPDKNTQDVFRRVVRDLDRYIRLNSEMEAKPFGYLPQLTGSQVAEFLQDCPDRLATLSVLAPFLSHHHIADITERLTIAEKAAFIGTMHDRHQSRATSTGDRLQKQQTEQLLRSYYEGLKNEATVDVLATDALEQSFLDSDRDCIDVVKILAARYGTVPKTYEKYLVSFEDFLGVDLGIAKKVLQRVSNDTLTIALADRELSAPWRELLGEMRSQLVESLKARRDDGASDQEIKEAQSEVLRVYRSLV